MSSIPPSNLPASIAQVIVTQRQRAVEEDSEKHQQAEKTREQAAANDLQDHQVKDTDQTDNPRVRRHDEEEARQRNKHKRKYQDQQSEDQTDQESSEHIDLQA